MPKDPMLKNRKPKANFYKRLLDPNRKHLQDWANPNNIATHKMAYVTIDNGNAIVYPEVQEVEGKLVDFSRPPYNASYPLDRAIATGDTIIMSEKDADKWTREYKNYYPGFKERKRLDEVKPLMKYGGNSKTRKPPMSTNKKIQIINTVKNSSLSNFVNYVRPPFVKTKPKLIKTILNDNDLKEISNFISYIENPDSIGFDKNTNTWHSPTSDKYDKNQIGMGIDKPNNPYLTDDERKPEATLSKERELEIRYKTIKDLEKNYNNRMAYANKLIPEFNGILSNHKRKLLFQALYKRPGAVSNWWELDNIQKYIEATDDEATDMIKDFHEKYFTRTYKERNNNLDRSLNRNQ